MPVTLIATAPDASWVAYCSADADTNNDGKLEASFDPSGAARGDALTARLAVTGREPLAIEQLYDSDPSGRFVLAAVGEATVLLDTSNGATTDLGALGADTRADVSGLPGHRAFAFSPNGDRLAYLSKGARLEVVVRELATGAEKRFDPGAGEIYRIAFDASGSSLIETALVTDSNKNGKLDWPFPAARKRPPACRGPEARLSARYPQGDAPLTLLLSLADGAARTLPGFVTQLRDGAVLRRESGELVLDPGGKPTLLTPAKCQGRVLHADALRNVLVVACPGKKAPVKADVELLAKGYQKPLNLAVHTTELDAAATVGTRLVPLYPGLDAQLVDLERRELHALKSGDLVIATLDARALVRRKDRLIVYDADLRVETELAVKLDRLPQVLVQSPFAVVTPAVVDLAQGRLAGTTPARPLALSRSGKLLLAEGGGPSAERLARGPLRWKDPEAVAGPSTPRQ